MLTLYLGLIDTNEGKQFFEDLYYAYRKQMLKVAYEVLNNYSIAEDAVQEAFLKIAKNISTVESLPQQAVKAYVLTATKHSALNLKRDESRAFISMPVLEAVDNTDSAYARVVTQETITEMKDIMMQLPLLYREVLMMRFVYDMDYKGIASILGRKPATIRQQVLRGRKLLQDICAKEGIFCEL